MTIKQHGQSVGLVSSAKKEDEVEEYQHILAMIIWSIRRRRQVMPGTRSRTRHLLYSSIATIDLRRSGMMAAGDGPYDD